MPSLDPIDAMRLRDLLIEPGGLWQDIQVVEESGSTNADLAALARAGASSGSILTTEFQSAGKGRLGRTWTAPPRTGIAMSLLVRPEVAPQRWTWLPLIAGIAVVESLHRAADVTAELKWPNDVLIKDRKVCGILAERVETPEHGPGCVLGIGLNVELTTDELPVPTATSLLLENAKTTNRTVLIATIARAFALLYDHWQTTDDDTGMAVSYLKRSATIGRQVRVELPGEQSVTGLAEAIDYDGRLVVRTSDGARSFSAGDVVHLR